MRSRRALADGDFDLARLGLFDSRESQGQDPLLQFRANFSLIDFVAQLELAEKIHELILAVQRLAGAAMSCYATDRQQVVFHPNVQALFGDPGQVRKV